jgi:general stress protein YciG
VDWLINGRGVDFPVQRIQARGKENQVAGPKERDKRTRTFRDPKIASAAGKVGGALAAPERRTFSRNRDLAREAGRKGGLAAAKKKKLASDE